MPIVVGYEPVAAIGQAAYGAGLAERIQRVAEQQAQLDAQAAAESMRQNFQRELTRRGMDERKAEQEAERAWRTLEAEKQREFQQTEGSAQRLHGYLSGEETRTAAEERQKAAIKAADERQRTAIDAQEAGLAFKAQNAQDMQLIRNVENNISRMRRSGGDADELAAALAVFRNAIGTREVRGQASASARQYALDKLNAAIVKSGGLREEPQDFWSSDKPGEWTSPQSGVTYYRGPDGKLGHVTPKAETEDKAAAREKTRWDAFIGGIEKDFDKRYEAWAKILDNPLPEPKRPTLQEIYQRARLRNLTPPEQFMDELDLERNPLNRPQSAPGPTGAPPPTRAERQAKFLQDNPTAAPLWSQAKGTADALRSPTYQRATPAQQQEMVVEYNRLMKQLEDLGFPLK